MVTLVSDRSQPHDSDKDDEYAPLDYEAFQRALGLRQEAKQAREGVGV
jgi:hypothetical protein